MLSNVDCENITKIMTLCVRRCNEHQYTFFITSRWVLLRMKNVSDESRRENQNTFFVQNCFSKVIPFMR